MDQTQKAQDYGEAREADKDICEAPSSEESGDETAPALEPETIGIRSIRGISIQVGGHAKLSAIPSCWGP